MKLQTYKQAEGWCANGVQIEKGFHTVMYKTLDNLCSHSGLNQGPPDYESGALTS